MAGAAEARNNFYDALKRPKTDFNLCIVSVRFLVITLPRVALPVMVYRS
jgi:hypothetical protein